MSTTLFERSARSTRLTPAGQNLMRHVGSAFDNLRHGIEEVAGRGPQLLRVHCAPSFAAQWLAPRLDQFIAAEPKLEVRLAASTEYARFGNDDFDLDIVYGQPRSELWKSFRSARRPLRPCVRRRLQRRSANRRICSARCLFVQRSRRFNGTNGLPRMGLRHPPFMGCVSTAASWRLLWLQAVSASPWNPRDLPSARSRRADWSPRSPAGPSISAMSATISSSLAPTGSAAQCGHSPIGSCQSLIGLPRGCSGPHAARALPTRSSFCQRDPPSCVC